MNWESKQLQWRLLSWGILLSLILFLFRSTFSSGQLITPDFFLLFSVNRSTYGIMVYLSQWNPGGLGYSSSQPAVYVILSALTLAGIPPALTAPLTLIGLCFVGAASFQRFLEPRLEAPKFALLGAGLFLLSPYLFIDVFNASSALPFDLLLPTVFLLAFRMIEQPWAKPMILLSLVFGFSFAFDPIAPAFALPLLLLIPLSIGLTRRSVYTALRAFGGIASALIAGLFLNFPFYLGNLAHFGSSSLQPSVQAAVSIIPISYGFSTPLHFFSLLGAGLYTRYDGYYPPTSEALLVLFSAFALSGLLFRRGGLNRELVVVACLFYVACAAWIFLTRAGLTTPLYARFGILAALNYPAEFYAYIVISITTLATVAVDRIAQVERERRASRAKSNSPKTIDEEAVTKRSGTHRIRRGFGGIIRQPLTTASCVAVLALLVVPAGFYLESGDFRVSEAPDAFGFPSQWGATVPSAYPAMYDFLESHGGTLDSRFLILPFPGFDGGTQFNPFAINSFGLTEYQGNTTAVGLFMGPRPSEFSTSVLDYLIENRTNRIGILLGEASVRYVMVDLQANFTGPPTWAWNSLVGSPSAFLGLLRAQTDLEEVFNDSLFVAFLNLDFQPYVTGTSGVAVVHSGNPSVPLNQTIENWPAKQDNWSSPAPSSRIASVQILSDGYEVVGVNGSGVMNITFLNATDTVTGSSTRLDNLGFYVLANRVQVVSQSYVVRFHQTYTGPANHAGYVTIVGYDINGTFLWAVPSYTIGAASTQPNVAVPFNPEELDSRTAYVQVSISFPSNFGEGILASYSVSNLSLTVSLPSIPSGMLATLFLTQMPPEAAISNYAPLPSLDFSNSTASALAQAGTPVNQLCLGLCSAATFVSDQLIFAYSALNRSGNAGAVEANPNGLTGEVVATSGVLDASLAVNPSPFATLALRASGNGTVTIDSGSTSLVSFVVADPSMNWSLISLASQVQTDQLTIDARGSVRLDSLWLGPPTPGSSPGVPTTNSRTTITDSSLTAYAGTLGNSTTFVILSQGFDSSWSMTVGSITTSSLIAAGWENGFAIPRTAMGGNAYSIVFAAQVYHTLFVAVQSVALTALLVALVIVSIPKLSKRAARALRRLISSFLI